MRPDLKLEWVYRHDLKNGKHRIIPVSFSKNLGSIAATNESFWLPYNWEVMR